MGAITLLCEISATSDGTFHALKKFVNPEPVCVAKLFGSIAVECIILPQR